MDFHQTHSIEIRFVTGPENNDTVRRRVPALLSPEILRAGAVKGLNQRCITTTKDYKYMYLKSLLLLFWHTELCLVT